MLSNIMQINSLEFGNLDGTGVAINNPNITTFHKSEKDAFKFFGAESWFNIIENVWSKYLIDGTNFFGHVRAASPGIPIAVSNSHPFIYDHLTGMHNGIIKNKHEFADKVTSDSEAFFKSLAEKVNSKPLDYITLKNELERI